MTAGARVPRAAVVISLALVVAAATLVGLSLRRQPTGTYALTPTVPEEVGTGRVGPRRLTVDASAEARWVFFDFSRGAVVEEPGPLEWDIAFRRFNVAVNGGAGFAGDGAVADLGPVPFDSVVVAPPTGWIASDARRDSANPAIARWYDYGFTSHLLTPRARTYAVRTADGRFAKLRFLSYYCPGAQPGCVSLEYVYQGDGSTDVRSEP